MGTVTLKPKTVLQSSLLILMNELQQHLSINVLASQRLQFQCQAYCLDNPYLLFTLHDLGSPKFKETSTLGSDSKKKEDPVAF